MVFGPLLIHAINQRGYPAIGRKLGFEYERRGRYARRTLKFGSLGAICQYPLSSSPKSDAKHAPESNLGKLNQSMDPFLPTRPAVEPFPIRA